MTGRRILFITTDQQRWDGLGVNGGSIARTPVIDGLAREGINYSRAHPQNVVCMPSRSTMITGQHPTTHGVWMNGVPLPESAPSIARTLREAGWRTALLGKAHFEPILDPFLRFAETRMGRHRETSEMVVLPDGSRVPHRGFDHMEFAAHGAVGPVHYAGWLRENHPHLIGGYLPNLDGDLEVQTAGGGATGAPQVKTDNAIPREHYHTDWVADRTIAWLDGMSDDDDWFCWMSFPDPHHPWDPPADELHRVDWRQLDLPPGWIDDPAERERVLAGKPAHWLGWWNGSFISNFEAPAKWVPATLTADQVREINAMVHVKNELIDEAIGRVMARMHERGWNDDLDVVYTTDHGEMQGDYGLLFKGPYHVDSLMRLPLIWRPAPARKVPASVVTAPVGHVSLAATFASIAGLPRPDYTEAPALPLNDTDARERGFERVLTEWDSVLFGKVVGARTIHRDGLTCTAMLPGTVHDGTEGELYDHAHDPLQRVNLWDDPAWRTVRDDLLADMWDHLPAATAERRPCDAPV